MTDHRHDIEKYLKGELTSAERHALEKKALNDPFVADALEGAEEINAVDFSRDVAELNKKVAGKKTVSVWMWTARIAAGLAFILVATFIVWNISQTEPAQELALKNDKKEEAPVASEDSVTSSTGKLSSSPTESPAAGPTPKDQAPQIKQPAAPAKTEPKPQVAETKPEDKSGDIQTKNEAVAEVAATREAEEKAKEKADEIKVTEAIAQTQTLAKGPESYPAKAADDRDERTRSISKKKAVAADKEAPAPSVADGSSVAGFRATTNIIQGQVTSAEDGSPLPGVNVVIKNSNVGTATDAQGNYQIVVPDANPTLVYSFIGLQSTEVKVDERKEVNVTMAQDATQLSEVVTVGYGVQSAGESVPPTVELAHPEIGNRAYKQYLEKNIRYPEQAKTTKTEGRVTVEFTIEPNGSLTNFTVIRGIGSGCDEELIRLIKEGPKWIPTKKNNLSVQDKAKVRLKFELPH